MSKIELCLWYDDCAEEAADFYVSTFRECGQDAEINGITHDTEVGPHPSGTVLTVEFSLAGQGFIALNGGPHFTLTPALSLTVTCKDQAEVDRFWEKLSAGGKEEQCGWLTDKFGLSWQVVPTIIRDVMKDPDKQKVSRVMAALLQMKKLDIAILENAYAR